MKNDREIVKRFISEHWTDEKLAQVFAFNEDGKMDFLDPCACILGVHSSAILHTSATRVLRIQKRFGWFRWEKIYSRCEAYHFSKAKVNLAHIESAYCGLSYDDKFQKVSRQPVMAEILREIMTEREVARQKCAETLEAVAS